MSNNFLTGDIPSSIANFPRIMRLSFENNQFTSFPFDKVSQNLINLRVLTLSSNKIYVGSIGTILTQMFNNLSNLESLTLHSNQLTGDLSQWEHFDSDYSKNLTFFTLHKNNIYGKISPQIKLNKSVTSITLFDNRLSCLLPKNFIGYGGDMYTNTSNDDINVTGDFYYMVILGNRFLIKNSKNYNEYMLIDASNLYFEERDVITGYICMSIAALCCMCIFVCQIDVCCRISKENLGYFCFWVVLVAACVVLSIFYYIDGNYYECSRMTGHFSLAYLTSTNMVLETPIFICIVIIQVMLVAVVYILSKDDNQDFQNKLQLKFNSVDKMKQNKKTDRRCKTFRLAICVLIYVFGMGMTFFYVLFHNLPDDDNIFGWKHSWILSIRDSLAIFLTIVNMYVVPWMVDLLCRRKNKDKTKGKEKEKEKHDKRNKNRNKKSNKNKNSNDDSDEKGNKADDETNGCIKKYNRTFVISFFRLVLSFYFPLIVSGVVSQNCGNYWTKFWTYCQNGETGFDVTVETAIERYWYYPVVYDDTFNTIQKSQTWDVKSFEISKQSDVCETNDFGINSCLRQFLDIWIPQLLFKIFFVIFSPWLQLLWNEANYKWKLTLRLMNCVKFVLCSLCCCCRRCKNIVGKNDGLLNEKRDGNDSHDGNEDSNHVVFEIDSQYGMIVTKLELCIIFGIFAPYLLLIAMTAIVSNYYCYKCISSKKHWKITNAQYPLPSLLLLIAIIIEQTLTCIFVWSIFGDAYKFALVAINVSIDFAAVLTWLVKKSRHRAFVVSSNNENSNT